MPPPISRGNVNDAGGDERYVAVSPQARDERKTNIEEEQHLPDLQEKGGMGGKSLPAVLLGTMQDH